MLKHPLNTLAKGFRSASILQKNTFYGSRERFNDPVCQYFVNRLPGKITLGIATQLVPPYTAYYPLTLLILNALQYQNSLENHIKETFEATKSIQLTCRFKNNITHSPKTYGSRELIVLFCKGHSTFQWISGTVYQLHNATQLVRSD